MRLRERGFSNVSCRPQFLCRLDCLPLSHRRSKETFVWLYFGGRTRTHAHEFHNHLFVFGAIEVVRTGWVLHETAWLKGNGLIGRKFVSGPCIPSALDHRGVAGFSMKMRFTHHAGREFDLNNIETWFLRIAFDHGLLETEPVGLVDPFELIDRDANDALRRFLT